MDSHLKCPNISNLALMSCSIYYADYKVIDIILSALYDSMRKYCMICFIEQLSTTFY